VLVVGIIASLTTRLVRAGEQPSEKGQADGVLITLFLTAWSTPVPRCIQDNKEIWFVGRPREGHEPAG